ncbi:hypothetical protein CcaverHIS002_0604020 [Cutaneotrichosporon cavernicola]|uniref:Transcriptional regulator n=1 Tax=Cutaneotrichosporon cavernicola TaxID=279322 RepID=A0AA48QY11_9TREE|nr:uncharacterized protein CcaverHIS019_0603470 [Cutaneotrichosporon cavernicola]BEI86115.1 hypothetical protein CcaverHIS002_0604020 [Cutaneotrichosporon cavernicola]BEI93888.1 hypothetical protein CcaverHIS019_0603470 [Cutaneotrichosporon cavernicola]BEJ01666.1 hypothetical protein CcaverHIS631_0603480 [Cutaneotrichosporon cavernicola]BEJ09434.1 hypothetical protein CcaverHIS641_0603490 [Cutaneotrichosporon cavernicola]
MHIRADHAELDVGVLQDFIKNFPLGQLTTAIKTQHGPTIQTSHMPFVLDPGTDGSPGVLRGHMARANPQSKALREAAAASPKFTLDDEVLILFNAPVNAYVTPNFYVATKPDSGKVVPTWNYAAVQVYGRITVLAENDDAAGTFLAKQLDDLTDLLEGRAPHEKKWKVSDAPERYTDLLKKAIIGIQIKIDRIEGRFKLSQEMVDGDWSGVVQGFAALGTTEGLKMSKMVEERGKSRNLKV